MDEYSGMGSFRAASTLDRSRVFARFAKKRFPLESDWCDIMLWDLSQPNNQLKFEMVLFDPNLAPDFKFPLTSVGILGDVGIKLQEIPVGILAKRRKELLRSGLLPDVTDAMIELAKQLGVSHEIEEFDYDPASQEDLEPRNKILRRLVVPSGSRDFPAKFRAFVREIHRDPS